MTPEATREISKLRTEFYSLFADSLGTPVTITKEKSYASTPPKASWTDEQHRLNYVCIYAYSAPDVLVPDRPLVLRIGVNLGAELFAGPSRSKGSRRYNQTCQFYLTLLPPEALESMDWLIHVLQCSGDLTLESLPPSPYSLDCDSSLGQVASFWTRSAQQRVQQPVAALPLLS
ncbi:MAG: hypothetical protein HC922_05755 [Leptolyngbyaceae cyanobacterium SM2_3_12]|nr:hypothetical protein [Leptolyngbyaceae cyanobacterium SM2_3_12]